MGVLSGLASLNHDNALVWSCGGLVKASEVRNAVFTPIGSKDLLQLWIDTLPKVVGFTRTFET